LADGGEPLPGLEATGADELDELAVVVTRRGGGTRVSSDLTGRPATASAGGLQEHVTALVRKARRLGATDQQIRDAVDQALTRAEDSTP
jgi:DNA-binding transcriptional regulator YhcF (GntR family)